MEGGKAGNEKGEPAAAFFFFEIEGLPLLLPFALVLFFLSLSSASLLAARRIPARFATGPFPASRPCSRAWEEQKSGRRRSRES